MVGVQCHNAATMSLGCCQPCAVCPAILDMPSGDSTKDAHIRCWSMSAKKRKWIYFACLFLTTVVLHTCIRIEVLNARYNHFLPRTDWENGNPRWRCAASSLLLRSLERDIANDRYRRFMQAHPDESGSERDQFLGPPYSVAETIFIDAEMAYIRDWWQKCIDMFPQLASP